MSDEAGARTLSPGGVIAFTNGTRGAMHFRVEFGATGTLLLTGPPGTRFEITAGTGGGSITVHLEDAPSPGLHAV